MSHPSALVGDIGATNARFGLTHAPGESRVLACADHASLLDALKAYLGDRQPPRTAALAIAGPVTGDTVAMTNHPWRFSIEQTRAALGLERLLVVNDFVAAARAAPVLAATGRGLVPIGGAAADPAAPVAVLGPGTGLGAATLVPLGSGRFHAVAGEAGHATLPATDPLEAALIARLWRQLDHVSAERLLCGPGLLLLYQTLAEEIGTPAPLTTPEAVTAAGLKGRDTLAATTLDLFAAMLGTVAGNLALSVGARGGVYLAGGIVPQLLPWFAHSRFRARFIAKGRFRNYLAAIPVQVITDPLPALLGLEALLTDASA